MPTGKPRACHDAFCNEVPGQTSFCGDGTVDSLNGEACDDENNIDDDDCGNMHAALCGNGQMTVLKNAMMVTSNDA